MYTDMMWLLLGGITHTLCGILLNLRDIITTIEKKQTNIKSMHKKGYFYL